MNYNRGVGAFILSHLHVLFLPEYNQKRSLTIFLNKAMGGFLPRFICIHPPLLILAILKSPVICRKCLKYKIIQNYLKLKKS